MRVRFLILLGLLLAGCQTTVTPELATKAAALTGLERPEDIQSFRSLPFGQLRVRINNGPTGRMLLARDEHGTRQWLAKDGKAFWSRDGRIVASRGLRDDLHELHALEQLPSPQAVARGEGEPARRIGVFVRAAQSPELGWVLEYRLQRVGDPAAIQFGDRVRRLQRVEEHVYHPAQDKGWTNEYWVDLGTDRILISNQHLPGTPYRVRLEAGTSPADTEVPLPQAAQEAAQ